MKLVNHVFLIFLFLIVVSPLWSQPKALLPLSRTSLLFNSTPPPSIQLSKSIQALRFTTKSPVFPSLHQSMVVSTKNSLPSSYCAADLAFFCRLEVQMEKATKIPVRFRLGDVQQVDYLEGKYEGWRYGY